MEISAFGRTVVLGSHTRYPFFRECGVTGAGEQPGYSSCIDGRSTSAQVLHSVEDYCCFVNGLILEGAHIISGRNPNHYSETRQTNDEAIPDANTWIGKSHQHSEDHRLLPPPSSIITSINCVYIPATILAAKTNLLLRKTSRLAGREW